MTGPTVYSRTIPETIIAGKRLGRHVKHDPRSLSYLVEPDGTVASKSWTRVIPVLDQGAVGSCTGNAMVGALGTGNYYASLSAKLTAGLRLNEAEALNIYSAAETIDGDGPYPPNDNGSTGLSVAQAAKNAGLISGYQHITSVAAAQTAIQQGPFIVGSDWYTGMDSPDSNGLVTATGTVRGGHEYECFAYDAARDLWWFWNSWGPSYGVGGKFCYTSATFAALLATDGDATTFVPISSPPPIPKPPAPKPPAWPYAGRPDYFGPVTGPAVCHSGDPRYDNAACRANIVLIQKRLTALNYAGNVSPAWADGIYGPPTVTAVRRFQTAHRLPVSGCVAAGDWAALFTASTARPSLWRRIIATIAGWF